MNNNKLILIKKILYSLKKNNIGKILLNDFFSYEKKFKNSV